MASNLSEAALADDLVEEGARKNAEQRRQVMRTLDSTARREAKEQERSEAREESESRADEATAASLADRAKPQLHPLALHGPLGALVRLIERESEAHPAAVLFSLLVGFGVLIGRRVHCTIEDTRHHCNLFTLMIGPTSRGRKGTAYDRARRVLDLVDDDFVKNNIIGGIASGEAIIHRLRDIQSVPGQIAQTPRHKQLLVKESEFASITQRARRDGSILSVTFRSAWDGETLFNTTKGGDGGEKASEPHLGVIGMITEVELNATLSETEHHTGFVNRFLLCLSERTRVLPRSKPLDDAEVRPLIERIKVALAQLDGSPMDLMRDAGELWDSHLYKALTDGLPGKLDGIAARGAPLVRRVAMVFAVLDGARAVAPTHLLAAVAVFMYSVDTAIYVWGASPLSSLAVRGFDEISAAGDRGLTADGFRRAVGKQTKSHERTKCLEELKARGLITVSPQPSTGGRPAHVYKVSGGRNGDKSERVKRSESAAGLLGLDLCALSTLFDLPPERLRRDVVAADDSFTPRRRSTLNHSTLPLFDAQ
jgi:hypothetical protein